MLVSDETFEMDFAIDAKSQSRKAVFWTIGDRISLLRDGSTREDIAMNIWVRDRLGSVAIGNGVAIPQIVFPMQRKPVLCVTRLTHSVDFGGPAGDHQVDLVFAIAGDRRDKNIMLRLVARCELMTQNRRLLETFRSATCQSDIQHFFSMNNASVNSSLADGPD